MNKELLIGLDIGTTSAKAVLFDPRGDALAQAAEEYPTDYPQANWAEQNPEHWWQAACNTLQALFTGNVYSSDDVAAIGVSSQAPSLVALDARGQTLHPAMIWMDRRSEPECIWLRTHVDVERIVRINGGRVDPFFLLPKLLWYERNRPKLYQQTDTILQANGYIVYRLSGRRTMDASHGPLTLLFDARENRWSDELIRLSGVDPKPLPTAYPCGEIVGEISRTASVQTGLAIGTPVIAGMVDGTAASLEAGVVEPGQAVEMTGQSTVLLICSDQPYLADVLFPLGHAVPNRYLVVGAQVATGGSLRWFRDRLGDAEIREAEERDINPFDVLSERASMSPPGANRLLFLPYMYGERSPIWDSRARGVFFGLSLATTKPDMVRAVLEGAAFGLRHNVQYAAKAGFDVENLACVGGGSRSAIWNQIKADILQRPVHVPRAATGAPLGDAIAASVAVDLHASMDEAVRAMTSPGAVYEPDPEMAELYDALYEVFIGLHPSLKESFIRLSEVGLG